MRHREISITITETKVGLKFFMRLQVGQKRGQFLKLDNNFELEIHNEPS